MKPTILLFVTFCLTGCVYKLTVNVLPAVGQRMPAAVAEPLHEPEASPLEEKHDWLPLPGDMAPPPPPPRYLDQMPTIPAPRNYVPLPGDSMPSPYPIWQLNTVPYYTTNFGLIVTATNIITTLTTP